MYEQTGSSPASTRPLYSLAERLSPPHAEGFDAPSREEGTPAAPCPTPHCCIDLTERSLFTEAARSLPSVFRQWKKPPRESYPMGLAGNPLSSAYRAEVQALSGLFEREKRLPSGSGHGKAIAPHLHPRTDIRRLHIKSTSSLDHHCGLSSISTKPLRATDSSHPEFCLAP